ncbi:50S ribosomal protein L1 [Plasmodium brasilianum]|uniref:50S ribosomal protein L1 n=2 Tax=Plasmodium (Plasmodium) TaxID=418103 RepID=A0A1A8X753_PLAMA|nr:50S ribosomal protein L1, apicoplast, putative [Plasmodium malariae]KAI4835624.1 50S ribosomal protein L1 [Plasmodium brasilianum]SBT01083.1 50S ribosomal protein L1 [Plasmodium malariae]SCP02552.1 50S ribosomal protein L1, apicoplast, putative [Plasmodium malariae]
MTNKNGLRAIIEILFIIYITTCSYVSESYIIKDSYCYHIAKIINLNCNYRRNLLKNKQISYTKVHNLSSPTITPPNNAKNYDTLENVKLKKKDKKILKKYKDFLDILPKKSVEYGIMDAIEKIKTLAVHKFVESIDIYLSFNQKKSKMTKNDNIKTFITFPHNLKKKREKKIYVVTNRNLYKTATDAGADVVGEDDLVNKIKEKEIKLKKKNNNFLLCTNDVIHKLTRVGKEVGRKGLMPNEKSGTLVSEFLLAKHIKLFKFENTYIFKLNKLNTLNLNVGDVYMSSDEIKENICYLFEYLDNLEFFHFNSKNLKTIYLSATMGFPFKIKKNFL